MNVNLKSFCAIAWYHCKARSMKYKSISQRLVLFCYFKLPSFHIYNKVVHNEYFNSNSPWKFQSKHSTDTNCREQLVFSIYIDVVSKFLPSDVFYLAFRNTERKQDTHTHTQLRQIYQLMTLSLNTCVEDQAF